MNFKYQTSGPDECESDIQHIIDVLKCFHSDAPKLREVALHCFHMTIGDIVPQILSLTTKLCAELEKILITFPTPTISFSSETRQAVLGDHRYHFWMGLLGSFFPILAERQIRCRTMCVIILDYPPTKSVMRLIEYYSASRVGHDSVIQTPIATSADGRWAATGSNDRTIIIWDLESRCISQEWFTENSDVDFLAFSPDSRYIMSVGRKAAARGEEATIWDLHQGGCRVRSLMAEGHDNRVANLNVVNIRCAWSPDGTWVVAGPQVDGTTHIWDTAAFRRPHLSTTWFGRLLAISSDGHWGCTTMIEDVNGPGILEGHCWIWNVHSGEPHQLLVGHTNRVNAAAFDRKGTRIITGSSDSTIRVWDVESGEQLLVLQEPMKWEITTVAFSEDGQMVLSHSKSPTGVDIWDASSGTLLTSLSRLHSDNSQTWYGPEYTVCFSPCGSYFASVWRYSIGKVLLWRTSDWSCIGEMCAGGESPVTHVAISPDGKVLCCGTDSGTVFFGCMHDLVSASQS